MKVAVPVVVLLGLLGSVPALARGHGHGHHHGGHLRSQYSTPPATSNGGAFLRINPAAGA